MTSEELRVAALAASAKRGKWVARRRIFWRWLSWLVWAIVLPVVGLVAVIAALAGLAFWQYMGHDAAYVAAQKWVQQEFGSFQTIVKNDNNSANTQHANDVNNTQPNRADNAGVIPLSSEATPELQIDRNLTIKTTP